MQEAREISIHIILEERLGNGEEVLASLEEQLFQDFQIVLLGQVNGERAQPDISDGKVMWLRNYRHRGFARIHNQAVALALARWSQKDLSQRLIVLCHPDVVWAPSALGCLREAFAKDPGLMIAGPTILRARRIPRDDEGGSDVERTDEIESQGADIYRSRRFVLRHQHEHLKEGGLAEPQSVFAIPEPCVVIRASALQELMIDGELLDPDIRVGQEMWDVMWRAKQMDMEIRVIPEAVIWHYAHEPARALSTFQRLRDWYHPRARQQRLREEERCLLELKNDDPLNRCLHLPWIMMSKFRRFFATCLDPRSLVWIEPERWLRIRHKRKELKKRQRATRKSLRSWFR